MGDLGRVKQLGARAAAAGASAKWMSVALAAVGAAVIGSLQLSDLGAIDDAGRRWALLLGAAAAVIGIIAAALVTVGAMLPQSTTVEDLADVERNPTSKPRLAEWLAANRAARLRSDKDSVAALVSDYKASLRELRVAYDDHYDNPGDPAKEQRARRAHEHTGFLNEIIWELNQAARLDQAKRALRTSRKIVAAVALVVVLAMCAFVWGATEPDEPAVDLRGATLTDSSLNDVELRGAQMDEMTIERADLSGTYLGDASIEKTKWIDTVCPDGVNSKNAGDTCAGHLKP